MRKLLKNKDWRLAHAVAEKLREELKAKWSGDVASDQALWGQEFEKLLPGIIAANPEWRVAMELEVAKSATDRSRAIGYFLDCVEEHGNLRRATDEAAKKFGMLPAPSATLPREEKPKREKAYTPKHAKPKPGGFWAWVKKHI